MRRRLIQTLLVVSAMTAGGIAYQKLVRPRGDVLRELAEAPLREMFGPRVEYDRPFLFDLADGIVIRNLRVPSGGLTADGEPLYGLQAARVLIEHDALALAAGRYRPLSIEIDGVRVVTHETPSGIAPDFPFVVSDQSGAGPMPSLSFRDGELMFRAMPGSERLREGSVLTLLIRELTLRPDDDGVVRVEGSLGTRGLGQDDAPISVKGSVDPRGDAFDLVAQWDPLELTEELLGVLSEPLAARLRQRSIRSGSFTLQLKRADGVSEGAIQPKIEWDSDVDISVPDLPGLEEIDASTKEQLQELFGGGALQLEVGEGKVSIKSLVTEMGGGRVHATGWVIQETGELHLDFEIRDLHLEDPAVKRALGEDGAALYDEFDPRGVVDAVGEVVRKPDGEIEWKVDVLLENASFRYVGGVGESGKREGFPYRVEDATGRVRIRSDGVFFDNIIGFNRGAEVRIVGHGAEAWTGGETGRIRFTDDGTEVRLTVIATNVPADEQLEVAIAGSEFSETMQDFDLRGVIDKIEVDVISIPSIEKAAKTELRITLEGEEFSYKPFPLPLEDVRGQITMRRPVLDGKRGRVFAFDVSGWAEGAPLRAHATIIEHERRGRLLVEAQGIPLAGALTETVLSSAATEKGLAPVWRWLGPRGKADVNVDFPLSDDPGPMTLSATLKGASLRLDAESSERPVEFTDLVGTLEVAGDDLTLKEMVGKLGEARVRVAGSLLGGIEGRWNLKARIDDLRITPDLQDALGRLATDGELLPGGMRFESGSRLGLSLDLRRDGRPDSELEVELEAHDLDAVVRLPDGAGIGLTGKHLAVRDGAVEARDLVLEFEGMTVRAPAARLGLGDGAEAVGRFEVRMDRYEVGEDLLRLVPGDAGELLRTWTDRRLVTTDSFVVDAPASGPVTLSGSLTFEMVPGEKGSEAPLGTIAFAPLVVQTQAGTAGATTLNGELQLNGFSVELGVELRDLRGRMRLDHLTLGDRPQGGARIEGISGNVAGVSVSGITAALTWSEGILNAPKVTGRVVDGVLDARFVMHTGEPAAYEGAATIRDFDVAKLRDDLAPTGAPLAGRGTLEVEFQNRGGELRDLTGSGTLHIREGRLGDLPLLTNVVIMADTAFGVDNPPQFDRAHVHFKLQNEVFRFSRFDLHGPLLDMPGRGKLDLTGVIDLLFTPDFIKGFVLPGVMQLPLVGGILRGVLREELLYAVRVRGDLSSAEPEIIPFPIFGTNRGDDFAGTGAPALPRRKLPGWFR